MRTYNELINLVRNWANRDEEVIKNSIIADCISYAADKAYRYLRVPPLEQTVSYNSTNLTTATYDSNNGGRSITELSIPSDLIEFIQIRGVDANNQTTRVFNEKTDIRTFYDIYAFKSNLGYWTRKGNNILLSPGFKDGITGASTEDSIELYYYKRLYALNARYEISAANANLSFSSYLEEVTDDNPAPTDLGTGNTVETKQLKKAVYKLVSDDSVVSTTYYETTVADASIPTAPVGQYIDTDVNNDIPIITCFGKEVPNWLRDENERVLLNGALAEVFIYLNEPESAIKYSELFMNEVQELNREEKQRVTTGGNIQVNFDGLLI